jgi:hypothetical protein
VLVLDIVDAAADTNLLDGDGKAALHLAIEHASSQGTVMALRIAKASQTDVNLRTSSGMTPMLLSVTTSNLEVLNALLDGMADPNLASGTAGSLPLHTAILQIPGERAKWKKLGSKPSKSESMALAIMQCGRADINLKVGACVFTPRNGSSIVTPRVHHLNPLSSSQHGAHAGWRWQATCVLERHLLQHPCAEKVDWDGLSAAGCA